MYAGDTADGLGGLSKKKPASKSLFGDDESDNDNDNWLGNGGGARSGGGVSGGLFG